MTITREKLNEIRSLWESKKFMASISRDHGFQLLYEIGSLLDEIESQRDTIRLSKGHMLHVTFTDCPECVAFHDKIRKLGAVATTGTMIEDILEVPAWLGDNSRLVISRAIRDFRDALAAVNEDPAAKKPAVNADGRQVEDKAEGV